MLRVGGGSPSNGWMAELLTPAFTPVTPATSSGIFTISFTKTVQRARGRKTRRSEGPPLFLALLIPRFSPDPRCGPAQTCQYAMHRALPSQKTRV
ncbi:hypothetical protein AALO_G00012620 [Alosa alosa]|uniref:Uncharacterized protein n=1 Tax=Alosa alosa TaxID=278164 RepID=A0AAV6HGP6_9TELE|nr:hypothetical protein AALO_G00012620 [Alosa alosa]